MSLTDRTDYSDFHFGHP